MEYVIENDFLKVTIISKGAEVTSLYNKNGNFEHIHNRDSKFWSRSAPILFPNIGKYKNNEYTYDNKVFKQKQHGFLRDVEFKLEESRKDFISFSYEANEETLKVYPFKFRVVVRYKLESNKLLTGYDVENIDDKLMYFQVGGHPAYNLLSERNKSYFYFEDYDFIERSFVNKEGFYIDKKEILNLYNGYLRMTDDLFLDDALIIEDSNLKEIALCDENKNIFLKFRSNALLFGLWIPNLDSPFVSIEPWCGRCDRDDFKGDISKRDYEQVLEPNKIFTLEYEVEV